MQPASKLFSPNTFYSRRADDQFVTAEEVNQAWAAIDSSEANKDSRAESIEFLINIAVLQPSTGDGNRSPTFPDPTQRAVETLQFLLRSGSEEVKAEINDQLRKLGKWDNDKTSNTGQSISLHEKAFTLPSNLLTALGVPPSFLSAGSPATPHNSPRASPPPLRERAATMGSSASVMQPKASNPSLSRSAAEPVAAGVPGRSESKYSDNTLPAVAPRGQPSKHAPQEFGRREHKHSGGGSLLSQKALGASAVQSARSVAAPPSSQALSDQNSQALLAKTDADLRSVRRAEALAKQELQAATQVLSRPKSPLKHLFGISITEAAIRDEALAAWPAKVEVAKRQIEVLNNRIPALEKLASLAQSRRELAGEYGGLVDRKNAGVDRGASQEELQKSRLVKEELPAWQKRWDAEDTQFREKWNALGLGNPPTQPPGSLPSGPSQLGSASSVVGQSKHQVNSPASAAAPTSIPREGKGSVSSAALRADTPPPPLAGPEAP